MNRLQLLPRIAAHKLSRATGMPQATPVSMTISVTNQCNSRCKTCMIWELYRREPEKKKTEMTTDEYEAIFKSIKSPVFWFTLSGGEPCLRPDMVEIAAYIYKYCHPAILNIPTNGLLPAMIEDKISRVTDIYSKAMVIVNLSLDGVAERHDQIRGVPGNFEKAMDTYHRLVRLKKTHSNLEVGVHSVVSKFNVDKLMDTYEYVTKTLGPDSYICEIAEHRNELYNTGDDISPDIPAYEEFVKKLSQGIRADSSKWQGVPKLIQAFRLEYYNLLLKELKLGKQIIPCCAGFTTGHLSCYGEVWPCCIQADEASFGNVRDVGYDFMKVWRSQKAKLIRKMIKKGGCSCPTSTANTHYTSMLCDPATMLRVLRNLIKVSST